MIWLTWRQFRTQAIVVYTALAGFAGVLLATGPHLPRLHAAVGSSFVQLVSGSDYDLYLCGSLLVRALPAVIGIFWGAPLVARELEAGTHRLVWNQTVTRTRWLAAEFALAGLAAVAATGLLTLAVSWWCNPIDQALDDGSGPGPGFIPRLSPMMFDSRGVAPIGYAAFAFALGAAIGVVVRRTVPAMAATLAVFAGVETAMSMWIRPHLIPPTRVTVPVTADNLQGLRNGGLSVDLGHHGAWFVSQQTLDAAGRPVPVPPSFFDCMQSGAGIRRCGAELARQGYQQEATYHLAGHFWPLQWAQTGLLLALAVLTTGLCFWWTRRHVS
ncbi:ABC transporter permease subunit [Streptacidiphilus carbonis]|uniref:ABC transporter permease subunit n=1 Tax=Streptacidiphilus carbonis TaxID=105422 RepID=UPI0005A67505|nr:ABC transporter permease subunit [Streptacidiphilus carbonis]